jgi:hypothetical protein
VRGLDLAFTKRLDAPISDHFSPTIESLPPVWDSRG